MYASFKEIYVEPVSGMMFGRRFWFWLVWGVFKRSLQIGHPEERSEHACEKGQGESREAVHGRRCRLHHESISSLWKIARQHRKDIDAFLAGS